MRPDQRKRLNQLRKKLLSSNTASLPKDKAEFFRTVLHIEPFQYQTQFLQDPAPLKVLRWCRRAGKTTMMSGDDIHYAVHHPDSRIIVTMPKFQQIKEIYFQGEGGLHSHLARMDRPIYQQLVAEQLQTIVRFRNGSVILAETPEPFTIRGHSPSKLSIDEMNFVRQDRDLWLSALLPMTLTRTVHINVASTPWHKDSIYHSMCFDKAFKIFSGNIHEHDPPRFLCTWQGALKPNGPLDPGQVETMQQQYAGDPWRWKREMECAFVDDESAFLPCSLIIKCQNEDLEFAKFEDQLQGNFHIGWDLGREKDPAAVAVINLEADVRKLVHCIQFPLKTPHVTVMGYIKSICSRWRTVRAVYYDHTGTLGMDEQIQKLGLPGLDGIDFSKQTKHGMAILLKELMMTPRDSDRLLAPEEARRRFELPFNKDVQAELNVEQYEQTPYTELYTFSHPEGTHDDRFWAIALAVFASRKPMASGLVGLGTLGEKR